MKIIYNGIDKDGIPRVWGVTKSQCELAIEEYNAKKPKGFKKFLRVVEAKMEEKYPNGQN